MTEFQARDAVENRRRRRRMMEEEEEYFSSSPPRGMMMVARSSNVHANGLHLHRPSSTTTATLLLGTSLDETEVGGNFCVKSTILFLKYEIRDSNTPPRSLLSFYCNRSYCVDVTRLIQTTLPLPLFRMCSFRIK